MHIEHAKEMDVVGDSNMHKPDPINVMHAAHEEEKNDSPWPMTKLH